MDFLIAKVKGRSRPNHFKLLSDVTIFNFMISTDSCVEYDPGHNLDEDGWFKLSDFKTRPFCPDFIKNNQATAEFNQILSSSYKDIVYLCSFQNIGICFQKVTPSLYVNNPMLCFGENVTVEQTGRKIFINSLPDAVYIASQDILVFKNLATISSIFKGIDLLYKEATQEEVRTFLDEPFINLAANYSPEIVSKSNRKRIALAMDILSEMEEDVKNEMFDYIHTYCKHINYDPGQKQFSIADDAQLKFLLYGIEQKFYTTPYTHEKRLANSVQKLGAF